MRIFIKMEKRLSLMEQIEVLKEYNPKRTIEEMKMLLDGMLKYDDATGVFDVVLIDGINRNTNRKQKRTKKTHKK